MLFRRRIVASRLVAAFALLGCGCGTADSRCMTVGGPGPLIEKAALFHLDVYGSGVACHGATVAKGATPILSANFLAGDPIALAVPSGTHALVLTAFADRAGAHLLGGTCLVADLAAGSPLCLDLPVIAADAAGFSPSDGGAGDAAPLDCPGAGCPCDQTWDCGFLNNLSCCSHTCVSTRSDPAHCGSCDNACGTDHVMSATCSSGNCSYQCETGFANCDSKSPHASGCNVATDEIASCGGCAPCDTASSTGASCDGTSCHYDGCMPGHMDCNGGSPNADGCECATPACCKSSCQTTHDNGVGQSYFDCGQRGDCDQDAATAACAAFTGDVAQCHPLDCGGGKSAVCSDGGSRCICWGYTANLKSRWFDSGSAQCSCNAGNSGSWN